MKLSQGYLLHEDPQRIVIATGFKRPSDNPKTGPMIQVWILVKAREPLDAIRRGLNPVVCGTCVMQGLIPELRPKGRTVKPKGKSGRSCYVWLGQGPTQVWRAYKRGNYPMLSPEHYSQVFAGRAVRWGAYGDPAYIPVPILQAVNAAANNHTGYTHQWREQWAQGLKPYVMASTESTAGNDAARALGWRTFRVLPKRAALTMEPTEVLCPNSSHGIQCKDCSLCSGSGPKASAKSIVIAAHGTGAVYV